MPTATFPRSMRLAHDREYQAVYGARCSRSRGVVVVHALPTDRPRPRLGVSVGKRLGGAVVRNRVKRLIREAFRLGQHDLPSGYDMVVSVRPPADKLPELGELTSLLVALARDCAAEWEKRHRRAHGDGP